MPFLLFHHGEGKGGATLKRPFSKTQLIGALAIIFGIGMLIDILMHRFEPVALIFSVVILMLGQHFRKKGKRVRGNIFLIIGILALIANVFSSIAFQLVLVAVLIYIGYDLIASSQKPPILQVETKESVQNRRIVRCQPFLKNMPIGNYRVMDSIYELHDINIRYGLGDVQIDLTTAMIPEGETVIVIHGIAGNIRLYVPYDIEISLNHSVLVGNISLFGQKENGFNKNVVLMTEQYANAPRRIKIISSLLAGDTEVRHA